MINLAGVDLHEDFIWINEFKESAVAQKKKPSLSGALIVRSTIKIKGRIIILHADDLSGWIKRSTVKALQTKLLDVLPMILTLNDGRTFNVMFDAENTPINAEPIIDYSDPEDTDNSALTHEIKLS